MLAQGRFKGPGKLGERDTGHTPPPPTPHAGGHGRGRGWGAICDGDGGDTSKTFRLYGTGLINKHPPSDQVVHEPLRRQTVLGELV